MVNSFQKMLCAYNVDQMTVCLLSWLKYIVSGNVNWTSSLTMNVESKEFVNYVYSVLGCAFPLSMIEECNI